MACFPIHCRRQGPRAHPCLRAYPRLGGATTLRDSEHTLILRTLEGVGWVIGGPKGAAAKLGLKRTTLIHKMHKLGISRPSLQSNQDVMGRAPQSPEWLPQ